jgi:anti-sigma factor RsiW
MSAEEDDAELVAYIDGELEMSARGALEARLLGDARLRERLARLREGGRPFAAAFEPLLDAAPLARLEASLATLDGAGSGRAAGPRPRRIGWSRLAAAAAIVLFCLGVAVGRYGLGSLRGEDWRQAVADYLSLYTTDTFAGLPAPQQEELAPLNARLGLDLSLGRLALGNLQFKGAVIFAYDEAPLGQLAYLDAATGPVLFCIIRDARPDAPVEEGKRAGFHYASWARAGRGFMLIGRLPASETAALADELRRRF